MTTAVEESNFSPHVRVQPRILLVDDDSVFRLALSTAMRQWGFVVHEADTAARAYATAQAAALDLAVLDIHLPDESGIALARRLSPLPVLFVTYDEDLRLVESTYEDRLLRRQTVGYVLKPFELSRFEPTIRTAVLLAQELRRQREVLLASTRAAERERKAIAREIGESIIPTLTAAQREAAALFRGGDRAGGDALADGARIVGLLGLAEHTARRVMARLHPEPVQPLGLTSACLLLAQHYAELQPQALCIMRFAGEARTVTQDMAGVVYRVVNDLLEFVRLYLHPSRVSVLVGFPGAHGASTPELSITVAHDSNVGLQQPQTAAAEAFDLLKEEIARLTGSVTVADAPGTSSITVHLPADLLAAPPAAVAGT